MSSIDTTNAERFFQSMQKIKQLHLNAEVIGDLSHSEFVMIQLVSCSAEVEKGITVSALSDKLKISKPAVSQMINILEDKGYAQRISTKEDRRIVYVKLTQLGRERLNQSLEFLRKMACDIFERMGEEDADTFLRLLDKLYTIAQEYRNSQ